MAQVPNGSPGAHRLAQKIHWRWVVCHWRKGSSAPFSAAAAEAELYFQVDGVGT